MGIKVVDLLILFVCGGKVGLFGGVGFGKMVIFIEFIVWIVFLYGGYFVFVGVGEWICEGIDLWLEM